MGDAALLLLGVGVAGIVGSIVSDVVERIAEPLRRKRAERAQTRARLLGVMVERTKRRGIYR